MKTYNVVFDKSVDIENLLTNMADRHIIVNKVFTSMQVINVSCESDTLLNIDGILDVEEDLNIQVEPSSTYWHKLRVVSNALPMKETYLPINNGDGVKVYLIDSGININLDEFANSNIINCYSYNENFSDDSGHGTAMASLMVGATLGVSTKIELKNVKIQMGTAINISDLLLAFDAILQDKTNPSEIAVINCSWTVPRSKILDTKIKEMQDNNFVVVAAAGNTVSDANNLSPVGLDTVIGVGASDAFDRVINWAPNAGSNWGPDVDIFAPGVDVSVLQLDNAISEWSGTSLAAAITSAVTAQYIKDLDPADNLTAYHVQFMVVYGGISDVLFRNESVYGTTPNNLLYISSFDSFIKNLPKQKINVQIGTTYELTLEPDTSYVQYIDIDDVVLGNIPRICPNWISLDKTTNTFKFSPTDINLVQNTRIYFKTVNHDNEVLAIYPLIINTYITDPSENDAHELYQYREENGIIVVTRAACDAFCNFTCNAIPPKGGACGCPGAFSTCFTSA